MKLVIEIETDNAAFEHCRREECIRILCELARKLEDGQRVPITLYDVNGNRVGKADFVKA